MSAVPPSATDAVGAAEAALLVESPLPADRLATGELGGDLARIAAWFIACSLAYWLAVLFVAGAPGFPLDDSYIHLQFARNLYERGEMSFNPGIPSSGCTAPAFPVLVAAVYAVVGSWALASHLVAALAGLAVCVLVYLIVRDWTGMRSAARSAAALSVLAFPTVLLAYSGMEATCYSAVFLAGLWAFGRGGVPGRLAASACFAIGVWFRPEFGAMLPVVLLERASRFRGAADRSRTALVRECLGIVAIWAIVLAAYAAYHWHQDAHFVPTTFAAKAVSPFAIRPPWLDGAVAALRHGHVGQMLFAVLVLCPANLLFIGLGLGWICVPLAFGMLASCRALWNAPHPAAPAMRLAVLSLVGYPLLRALAEPTGTIWFQSQRYFAHLTPLFIIIAFGAWPWTRSLAAHRRWNWTGLPLAVQARRASTWAAASAIVMTAWAALGVGNINDMQLRAADWLREHTGEHELIATNDIGAIGFFTRRPVLDTIGLVEPDIVRHYLAGGTLVEYLQRRRPAYLAVFPHWYPAVDERRDLFHPVHRIRLGFNVMCGGSELVIYQPARHAANATAGAESWFLNSRVPAMTRENNMGDLIWLEGFDGQSVDELLALEGTHRVDSLVLAFEQAIDQKRAREGDESLSEAEWTVLAVESLEREVNNGGYRQFFVNTVEFAPIIVDSLRRIGCAKTAAISGDAIAALKLPELTVSAIEQVIYGDDNQRDEALGQCDDRFFEYVERIDENLLKYIRLHKEKIRF